MSEWLDDDGVGDDGECDKPSILMTPFLPSMGE